MMRQFKRDCKSYVANQFAMAEQSSFNNNSTSNHDAGQVVRKNPISRVLNQCQGYSRTCHWCLLRASCPTLNLPQDLILRPLSFQPATTVVGQ